MNLFRFFCLKNPFNWRAIETEGNPVPPPIYTYLFSQDDKNLISQEGDYLVANE